jgi:hypothetical protein
MVQIETDCLWLYLMACRESQLRAVLIDPDASIPSVEYAIGRLRTDFGYRDSQLRWLLQEAGLYYRLRLLKLLDSSRPH